MYISRVFSERFLAYASYDLIAIVYLFTVLILNPLLPQKKMLAKHICNHLLTPSLNTFFKAYLEFLFNTLQ